MAVTKQDVLTLLDDARQAQLSFIDGLPELQRAAVGMKQNWSAKDFVSHITFWEEDLA